MKGFFVGTTVGKEFARGLRGANYATSEVEISSDRLIIWDRGYNQNGEQVWGPTRGPYIFKKIKDF